ncbi:hypothetical protein GQ607_006499 [Colletotrichum asianum]|uniref:Uncharacterized protein n=1 Tax=Colletotrichum asianum TaxID=702518 RepID=A0A8H3WCF4_9PEZI|nr:hypothetical protein GQ607_006499 [Colletotrichum asianum]
MDPNAVVDPTKLGAAKTANANSAAAVVGVAGVVLVSPVVLGTNARATNVVSPVAGGIVVVVFPVVLGTNARATDARATNVVGPKSAGATKA